MNLPKLELCVPADQITPLAELLREANYTESSVKELLGVWDLSQLKGTELPRYVRQCREANNTLSHLVKFLLLGENLTLDQATKLFGAPLLEALKACDFLFQDAQDLFCNAVLYPCAGKFIVTDYWVTGAGAREGQVYELGTDSFVLTRITPRDGVQRALDLCTGSGVHAVLSAASGIHSTAVDINPRALAYTQFNAALNSVSCEAHLGDLYTALAEGQFDLITANPPYVPSPDPEISIHRGVGETGEEIPERLVAELPKRLAPGGLFSMVLEYPVLESSTYLDRLEQWLGESSGWGIVVLSFGARSISAYIQQHIANSPDYDQKFERYLESYEKQGIVGVDFANVFILRDRAEQPNWKLQKLSPWPQEDREGSIREWLDTLKRYSSQSWVPEPDWKPELHSRYRTIWKNRESTAGYLEPVDPQWLPPEQLSAAETQLVWQLCGEQTVGELRDQWKKKGRDERSFLETLRSLGLQMALA